jgi:hypothetical protein
MASQLLTRVLSAKRETLSQKEENIMAGQILVSLSSDDRIEDLIPQIEQVAKPGTKVTFLMRYPVDPWAWLRDHWINSESAKDADGSGGLGGCLHRPFQNGRERPYSPGRGTIGDAGEEGPANDQVDAQNSRFSRMVQKNRFSAGAPSGLLIFGVG